MKPTPRPLQPQWLPPPPEPPPINRAQGCFAALLWLMPTVFVPICIGAAASVLNSSIGIIFGGIVCVAFVIGTGWFNASMSKAVLTAPPKEKNRRIWIRVVVFFLAQLFIVPAVLFAIVYAICAAYPMHL